MSYLKNNDNKSSKEDIVVDFKHYIKNARDHYNIYARVSENKF